MQRFQNQVRSMHDGSRLDQYLVQAGLPLSRRKIRQIIDVGGAYINGKRVRMASRVVHDGDTVKVEYSEAGLRSARAKDISLVAEDILFDQDNVVAINKPPGLPSQATLDQSVMHVVPCLEKFERDSRGKSRRFILAHRLDKETSGALLLATDGKTATWLTDGFRQHNIKKLYLALCYGKAPTASFSEHAPLAPIDKKTGDVRVVRAGGKSAHTDFRVLAYHAESNLSLIAAYPHTGRSHQIRVHLQHRGLPIVGDKRYSHPGGNDKIKPLSADLSTLASEHHLLHARAISFKTGAGQQLTTVSAPLPINFERILDRLGLTAASKIASTDPTA